MRLKVIILSLMGLLFTIAYAATTPTTRLSRPQLNELNRLIREASNDLNNNLPAGCVIAFVEITGELSNYILDELVANAVKDRMFTVADRNQITAIRQEQELQLSGEVADEQAVRIGRFSGAQYIVLGSVTTLGDGGIYRLAIRALDVETTNVQAQFVANIDIQSIREVRDKNRVGTSVFLGGNYNLANSKDTLGATLGYNLGAAYSFNFGYSPIVFETGLRYATRGYKVEDVDLTETLNYLEVLLKIKADFALGNSVACQPFVGIAPSFLLAAQAKWKGSSDSYDHKEAFESMNWLLPLGVDFLIMKSVLVGLEYDLGLVNIAKGSDNVSTNAVMFMLGWRF